MKKTKTHIQITIKEAIRTMKCLDTLSSEGGNFEYDIDGEMDENVREYNLQCKDAGRLSSKLRKLMGDNNVNN